MTKPITYEAIMQFDLRAIEAAFPLGAEEVKKDRYQPASSKRTATVTLARLLADKRKRMDKPRFLRRTPPAHRDRRDDSVAPPTAHEIEDAAEASAYTSDPTAAIDGADAVPPDFQRKITAKAHEDDRERRDVTVAAALRSERAELQGQLSTRQRVAQERGIAIRSDIRVIEKRLAEIDRKLGLAA